jgi:hypothetical protein
MVLSGRATGPKGAGRMVLPATSGEASTRFRRRPLISLVNPLAPLGSPRDALDLVTHAPRGANCDSISTNRCTEDSTIASMLWPLRRWWRACPGPRAELHRPTRLREKSRAESSHSPIPRREQKMQRFKSANSTERCLPTHGAAYNIFNTQSLWSAAPASASSSATLMLFGRPPQRPCR